jgi:hypothetical protein
VFYITASLLCAEFIIFTVFASATEQPWNTPEIVKTAGNDGEDVDEKTEELVKLAKV